jgi:hypothetical protein
MQQTRHITNPHIQEALDAFTILCQHYDLAGAVTFIDANEMGFAYHLGATWNGFVPDPDTPLGLRMRIKEAELGRERAQQFAAGTVWVLGALLDFGEQTNSWARDLWNMLKRAGLSLSRRRFGGQKLPRLTNLPPRP